MYPAGLYGSGNPTPVSLCVTTEITNRQEEADRTTWLTVGRWQQWTETATEPQLQELQSAKAWIHKCWWALYASGWLTCEIVLLIRGFIQPCTSHTCAGNMWKSLTCPGFSECCGWHPRPDRVYVGVNVCMHCCSWTEPDGSRSI